MKKKRITINYGEYPSDLYKFINGAEVFDSSCSPTAKVIYVDKDNGYYIKSADKGMLKQETELTRFFNKYGLATTVCEYLSYDRDWLVTAKVNGEDGTFYKYLEDPEKLCDVYADVLHRLHELDVKDCPVNNRIESYLNMAYNNYSKGIFDSDFSCCHNESITADIAWNIICENKNILDNNVLIHGDYCLPNIILDNWNFSGLIDVGNGGMGDRHIDVFWALWSLEFNLKTDKYNSRFLDAYGREYIDNDKLKLISIIEMFG